MICWTFLIIFALINRFEAQTVIKFGKRHIHLKKIHFEWNVEHVNWHKIFFLRSLNCVIVWSSSLRWDKNSCVACYLIKWIVITQPIWFNKLCVFRLQNILFFFFHLLSVWTRFSCLWVIFERVLFLKQRQLFVNKIVIEKLCCNLNCDCSVHAFISFFVLIEQVHFSMRTIKTLWMCLKLRFYVKMHSIRSTVWSR